MTYSTSEFTYQPSQYVPFRDTAEIDRVRAIKKEDLTKHSNPDFRIQMLKSEDIGFLWVTDMFWRIASARERGEKVVMILPNPCPVYRHVAAMINRFRIDCSHVYGFAMDEYASEENVIAPETWPFGFKYAMYKYFWGAIDEDLRPPKSQIIGPTNENLAAYDRMIEDMGHADICYSGPGWTGHLAFIEPDAPEFDAPLDEWLKMGTRICTLSPFTLAQNSMHGFFGKSGDLAAVPPKAATIGPAIVVNAKNRLEVHGISVHGTTTAWQRMISRLCLHGPVTPRLPSSIHQLLRTDCYISDVIAMPVEPDWDKEY
jgi:glucosamine-6-phosphate deaminase